MSKIAMTAAPTKATTFEFAGRNIGIVIEDERGFSFFAASRHYAALDGLSFGSLRQIHRAADAIVDRDTSRRHVKAIERWRRPARPFDLTVPATPLEAAP